MYAQLVNNLDELGFTDVEPYLSEYLTKASKEGISLLDSLIHISDREITLRNQRAAQIQVSVSHFPYIKTLDEFDYHFQPSVNKAEIKDLSTLRLLIKKRISYFTELREQVKLI
jgi:DNA replication protein DnaC